MGIDWNNIPLKAFPDQRSRCARRRPAPDGKLPSLPPVRRRYCYYSISYDINFNHLDVAKQRPAIGDRRARVNLIKIAGNDSAYLECWGPTLPESYAELAVMSASRIAPDSIPSGPVHWPATNKSHSINDPASSHQSPRPECYSSHVLETIWSVSVGGGGGREDQDPVPAPAPAATFIKPATFINLPGEPRPQRCPTVWPLIINDLQPSCGGFR